MPMKEAGKKVYKSLQGKLIDMDMLRQKNELTPAVSNVKVNARGDELGRGGKIVRSREEILKDYYKAQEGVPDENITKKVHIQPDEQPKDDTTKASTSTRRNKKEPAQQQSDDVLTVTPTAAEKEEWVENEAGDFVKKEK